MRRHAAFLATLAISAALTPARATIEEPAWAPVESATIRPGVRIAIGEESCTTNFIFLEGTAGGDIEVFIGTAAHCFIGEGGVGASGCLLPSLPVGTRARVDGADHDVTLEYSSWLTMQGVGEADANSCRANDFALVRLDPRDVPKANPSLIHFGGPTGFRSTTISEGELSYSYGASNLRPDDGDLSPRRGVVTINERGGWTQRVHYLTPGLFGDSGSAVVDSEGRASGILVSMQFTTGANGVTNLARALGYARTHTERKFELVPGTETFDDPLV